MKKYFLPITILFTSIFYIFILSTDSNWVRLPFKILPVLLIIFYIFSEDKKGKGAYKIFLLIGLIFCMLGDAFILFSFILGLVFFLTGHIFYIIAFVSNKRSVTKMKATFILVFILYAVIIGSKIIQAIKGEESYLILPVLIYITIIMIMGWMSLVTGNSIAVVGALLFIISDSILAYDKFVSPIIWSSEYIMITYYSAQFLLARSVSKKSW